MKRLIKYLTPVGEDEKGFVMAFVIVVSATLSILFLFTFLELIL